MKEVMTMQKKQIQAPEVKDLKRPDKVLGEVNMNPQCRAGGCC